MAARKGDDDSEKTEQEELWCCKRRCSSRRTRYRHHDYPRLLPQDVVFEFLLHVPARPLHNVVRHVCREWSLIISSPNFARHHHHRNSSSVGLVVQPHETPRKGMYLEMRRGRLEVSDFDCGFEGVVVTSCNGLVVIVGRRTPWDALVTNPLTKRFTPLPRPPGRSRIFGLSFAEASMAYKLAQLVSDGDDHIGPKTRIALLTIGVDRAWRHIDIRHLWHSVRESRFSCPAHATTGGYVHWAAPGSGVVLTLNLETETACRFSPPPQLPPKNLNGFFRAMGGNLSLVYLYGKVSFHVWQMESASGEWTLLFRVPINGGGMCNLGVVTPVCWLTPGEILVYVNKSGGAAYNCRTREVHSFEWGKWSPGRCWYNFQPHVNTFLWWE